MARADAASRALRALIRDYYIENFGPAPQGEAWELDLKIKVDPADNWALTFTPSLPQQLLPRMEALEAEQEIYQSGRVYCFRCETSDCEHAQPRASREIFEGYDQLGCPRWMELTQYLLDQGDERIHLLFGEKPGMISRQVRGRDLRERQLASFGKASKTYALLGQLIAGYFPLPGKGPGTHDFLAFTFQAVEVRSRSGQPRLELNTLYHLPDHLELGDLLAEYAWVRRARDAARNALDKITARVTLGKEGREPMKAVPDILRKLGAELERGKRQSRRQTQHARERKQIQRPVDKAMADLSQARPERMYWDVKTKAVVVWAERGRCHIFSDQGKHVTSFVIEPDAVRIRLKKRRWTALEADRRLAFMEAVGNVG